MSEYRNQHYVPEFYLKRFGIDNKIDMYIKNENKINRNQNVSKIAYIHNFYDVDIEKFKKDFSLLSKNDIKFIEHYLSRTETMTASMLENLDKDYNKIKDEDFKLNLLIFICDLTNRTEGERNFNKNIYEGIFENLKEAFASNLNVSINEMAKNNQIKKLLSVNYLLEFSSKLLNEYDWYIGKNTSDNINFIISDNPALFFQISFKEICFPLSKKLSLICRKKGMTKNVNGVIELTDKYILMNNCAQIYVANRFVFGDFNSISESLKFVKKDDVL